MHQQTFACPRETVGRLIGKRGATVKSVQMFAQVVVEIDQGQDPPLTTAFRSEESVDLAISEFSDIISGTFKGFTMLRSMAQHRAVQQNPLPRHVCRPGFGIVPGSEVGAESDR